MRYTCWHAYRKKKIKRSGGGNIWGCFRHSFGWGWGYIWWRNACVWVLGQSIFVPLWKQYQRDQQSESIISSRKNKPVSFSSYWKPRQCIVGQVSSCIPQEKKLLLVWLITARFSFNFLRDLKASNKWIHCSATLWVFPLRKLFPPCRAL